MTTCPCGSKKLMEECCGPYLNGTAVPETAEQMMRSRYTAFTVGDIKYIRKTTGGDALKDFNDAEALEWSKAKWLGLEVISTKKGTAADREGVVEFNASYEQEGKVLEHHEVSKFKRDAKGQWTFIDGDAHVHEGGGGHHHHHHAPVAQVIREAPKVGRNDPCPCGSGQKYKKCCGAAA